MHWGHDNYLKNPNGIVYALDLHEIVTTRALNLRTVSSFFACKDVYSIFLRCNSSSSAEKSAWGTRDSNIKPALEKELSDQQQAHHWTWNALAKRQRRYRIFEHSTSEHFHPWHTLMPMLHPLSLAPGWQCEIRESRQLSCTSSICDWQ